MLFTASKKAPTPIANSWLRACAKISGKRLILNCNILKTGWRRNFKFRENVFKVYPNILVKSEKLDLNALLNLIGSLPLSLSIYFKIFRFAISSLLG